MNYTKWIEHFARNRQNRPEPDWAAPSNVPAKRACADAEINRAIPAWATAGGPASLIAFDRENFRSRTAEMRQIVDLWFAEEAEHARLLGYAVRRFGGRIITSHWSFTAFCLCRRVLGVRFELQVLTLTELVSTAYYRMLRNHSPDGPLAAMCELILRDEAGHVAFQRDRLMDSGCPKSGLRGLFWRLQFLACGYAAGNGALDQSRAVFESDWRDARRILFGDHAANGPLHPFIAQTNKVSNHSRIVAKPSTSQLQLVK
ncbi:MAG: ferritin-like domain-containing protein [Limisphaerales bacterium]